MHDLDAEVFVVDNNSVDGSVGMIQNKFSRVKIIENKKNAGFSKANNQAIREASGEYILLLNPDTVVQEDTLTRCTEFMDQHPDAGALGVKMIDGKGNFLPESKRSLPTPLVAFFKIFGFSGLFPKSRLFGKYHLSFLDTNKTSEVEILSGAYMFIRKSAIKKTGLLDESFFMYGEDIDISYRLLKAGYKNYYFPETTIIHYKGESTKKGSLNYVIMFYNAMIIFAEKHFSKSNYRLYSLVIHLAIYLRASVSIAKRFIRRISLPLADGFIIFGGYFFLKPLWESIKFEGSGKYPDLYLHVVVPAYIALWLLSLLFTGAYDKPIKTGNIIKGIGTGTLIILSIYALLPLSLRFSRVMIVTGALWSMFSLVSFRYILHILNFKTFKLGDWQRKRVIIAGDSEEVRRVTQLLLQTQVNPDILGFVSNEHIENNDYLGRIDQLEDIVLIYKPDEIIFCAKDISAQNIIDYMLNLSQTEVEYKIAPPESLSIIGSNSINTAGDLYLININTVGKQSNRRAKRVFDFLSSIVLLFLIVLMIPFIKNRFRSIANIFKVLIGMNTWVGYYLHPKILTEDLPKIKKGIFSPADILDKKEIPQEFKEKLNFFYAKDYKVFNDMKILYQNLLHIGR
jgi:O-antigen biosynthesis protein